VYARADGVAQSRFGRNRKAQRCTGAAPQGEHCRIDEHVVDAHIPGRIQEPPLPRLSSRLQHRQGAIHPGLGGIVGQDDGRVHLRVPDGPRLGLIGGQADAVVDGPVRIAQLREHCRGCHPGGGIGGIDDEGAAPSLFGEVQIAGEGLAAPGVNMQDRGAPRLIRQLPLAGYQPLGSRPVEEAPLLILYNLMPLIEDGAA